MILREKLEAKAYTVVCDIREAILGAKARQENNVRHIFNIDLQGQNLIHPDIAYFRQCIVKGLELDTNPTIQSYSINSKIIGDNTVQIEFCLSVVNPEIWNCEA